MAEVMPINFPLPSESAIASYSYSDLAEQTGVQLFYAATCSTGEFVLTQNSFNSASVETLSTEADFDAAVFDLILDKDFDLTPFNAPQTIRGYAYINFFVAGIRTGGAGNIHYQLQALIRKWDGSTETEIASNAVVEFNPGTADARHICLRVTIPETHFKIGENLRLTIKGWGRGGTAGTTVKICIGHDPMNRDGTYIIPSTDVPESTTQFKLWIPFKLDL